MANFKNLIGGKAGMQSVLGITDATTPAGAPFTKSIYPGICLFGDATSPITVFRGVANSMGEMVVTISSGAIFYIQNDGFINPNASATVMNDSPTPYMDVLCLSTGSPWKILKVIDDTTFVIADPYGLFPSTPNCWFAKSDLYPNKKVMLHSEFLFNVFTMGGGSASPSFDGATYHFDAGDGINPISVIGLDTVTFSGVIK